MRKILFLGFVCFSLMLLVLGGCSKDSLTTDEVPSQCEDVVKKVVINCEAQIEQIEAENAEASRVLHNDYVAIKSERDWCWKEYNVDKGITELED